MYNISTCENEYNSLRVKPGWNKHDTIFEQYSIKNCRMLVFLLREEREKSNEIKMDEI